MKISFKNLVILFFVIILVSCIFGCSKEGLSVDKVEIYQTKPEGSSFQNDWTYMYVVKKHGMYFYSYVISPPSSVSELRWEISSTDPTLGLEDTFVIYRGYIEEKTGIDRDFLLPIDSPPKDLQGKEVLVEVNRGDVLEALDNMGDILGQVLSENP